MTQASMGAPMPVHRWPQRAAEALLALQSEAACVAISVATPDTENRTDARASIREALRTLVAEYLKQTAATIEFSSRSGVALALLHPAHSMGLSISHAPGCSVAAVHLRQAVGIDVVRVETNPVEADGAPFEWEQVAHEYLGPAVHQRLATTLPTERARAFAQAWSHLEAGLKCLGHGLTEWTPALEQALECCTFTALDLPPPLSGTLAVGPTRLSPDGVQQAYKPSISFKF